jgi:hypothetical protein
VVSCRYRFAARWAGPRSQIPSGSGPVVLGRGPVLSGWCRPGAFVPRFCPGGVVSVADAGSRPGTYPGTSVEVRRAGTGVPAQAAAAAARASFSTGDSDTTDAVPVGSWCPAGLPPAAASPTPAACSPDGDQTRGWHTAVPLKVPSLVLAN